MFLFKQPSVLARALCASICPPHDVQHDCTHYPLFYDPLYFPQYNCAVFESEQSVCQWLSTGLDTHFQNAVHVRVWALAPPIFRSPSILCALHCLLSNVMAWRAVFLFVMSSPPPFLFVDYIVMYSWILETRFHLHLILMIVGSMMDYLCLKMFCFG